jgi:transcriptional regulator with XRE-family HTH domain
MRVIHCLGRYGSLNELLFRYNLIYTLTRREVNSILYLYKKYLTVRVWIYRVEGMTLQELLKQHGIQTIADLSHRTGLSKQYGWLLWHGKVNIGLRMAKRLAESLGLPYTVFLDLERPVPPSERPPGRPPKRRTPPNRRRGNQRDSRTEGGAGA